MARWRSRLLHVAAVVVMAGGCAATTDAPASTDPFDPAAWTRPLGPGERWLPIARWDLPGGRTLLCSGGGTIGDFRLHGSPIDARLAWMVWPDGHRTELAFAAGWSARFMPDLEVLDAGGRVVAREGSPIIGTCGTAEPGVSRADF